MEIRYILSTNTIIIIMLNNNILRDTKYILIIMELTIAQAYFISDINLDLFLQYTTLLMISNSRAWRIILPEILYTKQHV